MEDGFHRNALYENRNLRVVTEEVCTPARSKPRSWTIVQRKPAVVIAPMTRDGKIVLIRQERIPIRAAIWEMPAGQIDDVAGVADRTKPPSKRSLCANCARRLVINSRKTERLSHSGIIFLLPVSRMNAVIFFWCAQWKQLQMATRTKNRNRFWIAEVSVRLNCHE